MQHMDVCVDGAREAFGELGEGKGRAEIPQEEEMIRLSHQMLELHHEHASWVPGYYNPALRIGHWRWLRYPDYFNHKHTRSAGQFWVHWVDEDIKKETLEARKNGTTFEPQINYYDQWKE